MTLNNPISSSSPWACLFYSCFRVSPEQRAEIDLEHGIVRTDIENNRPLEQVQNEVEDDFEDWDDTPTKDTAPKVSIQKEIVVQRSKDSIESSTKLSHKDEEINNNIKDSESSNITNAKQKAVIKTKHVEPPNNIQVTQIAKPKEAIVIPIAKAESVPEPELDFFSDMEPSVKKAVNVIRIVPKQTLKVETPPSSRLKLEETPADLGNWDDNAAALDLESEDPKSDTESKKKEISNKMEATKVNIKFNFDGES